MTTIFEPLRVLYCINTSGTGPVAKGAGLFRGLKRNSIEARVAIAGYCDVPIQYKFDANFVTIKSSELYKKLQQAVTEFRPQIIISCYEFAALKDILLQNKIPAILLWRLFNSNEFQFTNNFIPDIWNYVVGMEGTQGIMPQLVGDKWKTIAPILSCYKEDLYNQKEARHRLFAAAGRFDRGQNLVVAVHNGINRDEVSELVKYAMLTATPNDEVVAFSQRAGTVASNLQQEFTPLMQGVDRLVAYAGFNTWHEWNTFKRPDAANNFLAADRYFDSQEARITATLTNNDPLCYNGVDQLIPLIFQAVYPS